MPIGRGAAIAVESVGEGLAVRFANGFGNTPESWSRLIWSGVMEGVAILYAVPFAVFALF